MACIPEESVSRMARLIGDADKALCKVNKLRSITCKLDEKDIEAEAEIFKAMADPCHLSILKDAGLIKERKDGRWSRYRLSEGAVIELLNLVKLMREANV